MHQNCIKWHLKLICLEIFKTKEGRLTLSDKMGSSFSGLLKAVTHTNLLFFPSLYRSFLCAPFFSSYPKSQWYNPKINYLISPHFRLFQCFLDLHRSPVHHRGSLSKKSAENRKLGETWNYKKAQVIQVWLMRIVWSSSEVKTCASGIWLCREEDSWPTWWRTPSTGKAKLWWTTSRNTRWGRRVRPGSSPGWRTQPPPWASARYESSAPPSAVRSGWALWRRWRPRAQTPTQTAPERRTWGCHLDTRWLKPK